MLNRSNNQTNSTQIVISTDQNFILAKSIRNNFIDIVSPFTKSDNGTFSSDFTLPITQLHRIQTLYEQTMNIAQYNVSNNIINFDCLNDLPQDMFGNAIEGYIHLSAIKQHKKDKIEIIVDPKIVFQLVDYSPITFTYYQKIKFKSDFLKAFPIILKSGFIFSIVNKTTCQLFISITNPQEMFVGECSKYEITNLIQYILPLWPIFDIYIGKSIKINLQTDFIQDKYCNETSPILLYISYFLEKPEEITISKIANNVKV